MEKINIPLFHDIYSSYSKIQNNTKSPSGINLGYNKIILCYSYLLYNAQCTITFNKFTGQFYGYILFYLDLYMLYVDSKNVCVCVVINWEWNLHINLYPHIIITLCMEWWLKVVWMYLSENVFNSKHTWYVYIAVILEFKKDPLTLTCGKKTWITVVLWDQSYEVNYLDHVILML